MSFPSRSDVQTSGGGVQLRRLPVKDPLLRFKRSVADDADMREPIEFRQLTAMRIYVVCFALVWVGSLVALGIRSPSDALITVLMIVIGVAFIIRIVSVKFVADESGLMVRNFPDVALSMGRGGARLGLGSCRYG